MPGRPRAPNENTMKKHAKANDDDLRPEYDAEFFRNMKPNRFASRPKLGRVRSIILEPDVAEVFHSSDDVNAFLRSAIKTMPPRQAEKKEPTKRAS